MTDSEKYAEIIKRFDAMPDNDKIKYRRACGKMLNEGDTDLMLSFYRVTTGMIQTWEENRVFFALCIHALGLKNTSERVSLPEGIAAFIRSGSASDSFDKRVMKLMDSEWEDDGFLAEKIARMVKLLEKQSIVIDCETLMYDLVHWNDYSRSVQKSWARIIAQ